MSGEHARLFDEAPAPRHARAARRADAPAHARRARRPAQLLGPEAPLRRALEARPPALDDPARAARARARRRSRALIAAATGASFEEHSAVEAGRAEVRAVIERARHRGGATIFFLDEIHRFNKAQQDALLPAVEEGLVTLIGATTENPRFEVNSALLSRVTVYELERARRGGHRGAAAPRAGSASSAGVALDDDAVELLAQRSGGDARLALGALERAAALGDGRIDLAAAREALAAGPGPLRPRRRPALRHDLGLDQGDARAAIRTRRCTTWRRCSKAARTRASSRGGW